MQNLLQYKALFLAKLVAATSYGQNYGQGGYNSQTYGGKTFRIAGTHFHLSFSWLLLIISLAVLLIGMWLIIAARRRKRDDNPPSPPTLISPGV